MRWQPRAWASNTSASRRGNSTPFCARKRAVQSSNPPIVQDGSVLTVDSLFPVAALPQALLLVEVLEGLDQLAEGAGDDGVEFVEVEVDAVVGDSVLREVVGADALAAVAGADEGAALLGALLVQPLLLPFVQPAAQDAHGPVVVLVLAALVLALHLHFVGGAALVPDADGALGLVDVLAAGAAGAHPLPLDVLVLDLDLDRVGLGQDGHGGGGGVDAALLLGLGHALHAVAAALVAQVLEDVVAGEAEDDFLVAALLAGAEGDVLDLPTLVAGVVGVHAVEVAGEQGGLVAAGAGADLHDQAGEVLARLDQEEVFQPGLQRLHLLPLGGQLLLGVGAHLGVGLGGEQGLGLADVG